MKKITAIFSAAVVLIILFNVAIAVINNGIADSVRKDLIKTPLPENTQIISSASIAGKVVGNGNGMQYFGAVLVKSELPLEELKLYYSNYNYYVAVQTDKNINVIDHGSYSFNIKGGELTGHYIVYGFGHLEKGNFSDILEQFDLRGH